MKKIQVHPIAELFPMMSDEELDDLAADVKENGLLHPIVLDTEGVLVDGRNRLEACRRAEIEPSFETLDGQDPVAFILSNNVHRRHLSRGQQAMAIAFAHPEQQQGKKRTSIEKSEVAESRIRKARQVLKASRELAMAVLRGPPMTLDKALEQVIAAQKELESDEGKLAALQEEAPDLADLVAEERLPLDEAYAAFEKRKFEEQERKNNQRETMMRLGEQVYTSTVAWSVESFIQSVNESLEDEDFQTVFIARLRIEPSNLGDIERGAKVFAELLKTLTKKKK
jgi:ParB-like nuclease domain